MGNIYLITRSDFKLNALRYIMLLHLELFPAMIQFVTFHRASCNIVLKLPSVDIHNISKQRRKIPIGVSGMKYIYAINYRKELRLHYKFS